MASGKQTILLCSLPAVASSYFSFFIYCQKWMTVSTNLQSEWQPGSHNLQFITLGSAFFSSSLSFYPSPFSPSLLSFSLLPVNLSFIFRSFFSSYIFDPPIIRFSSLSLLLYSALIQLSHSCNLIYFIHIFDFPCIII